MLHQTLPTLSSNTPRPRGKRRWNTSEAASIELNQGFHKITKVDSTMVDIIIRSLTADFTLKKKYIIIVNMSQPNTTI